MQWISTERKSGLRRMPFRDLVRTECLLRGAQQGDCNTESRGGKERKTEIKTACSCSLHTHPHRCFLLFAGAALRRICISSRKSGRTRLCHIRRRGYLGMYVHFWSSAAPHFFSSSTFFVGIQFLDRALFDHAPDFHPCFVEL